MQKIATTIGVLVFAAALSACGHNTEQKAATGAATGLVIAGPVGAAVGGAAGAVTQKVEDNSK